MLKQHSAKLSTTKLPAAGNGLYGIQIGDPIDKLIDFRGQPDRIDPSDYAIKWHVYSGGGKYDQFAMYGVQDNRVVAAFSPSRTGWKLQNGLANGLTLASAKQKIGAVTGIQQDDIYYSYVAAGSRTYLFVDTIDQNKVVGILQRKEGIPLTTPRDGNLRDAMELQLFDLVNAERAARGIPVLMWDKLANKSARLHSEDMRDKNYFSHTNKENKSAFDRMEAQGINFQYAAENIAAGQKDSFLAHYSFLNSESHRKSLLDSKLTKLGVGIALGGSYKQYYTQHFYTPF
ncbi:CAP domain-containing protein [Paenibacillus soyae]